MGTRTDTIWGMRRESPNYFLCLLLLGTGMRSIPFGYAPHPSSLAFPVGDERCFPSFARLPVAFPLKGRGDVIVGNASER